MGGVAGGPIACASSAGAVAAAVCCSLSSGGLNAAARLKVANAVPAVAATDTIFTTPEARLRRRIWLLIGLPVGRVLSDEHRLTRDNAGLARSYLRVHPSDPTAMVGSRWTADIGPETYLLEGWTEMASKDTGGQKRTSKSSEDVDEVDVAAGSDATERKDKLDQDIDAILDDIDDVLEENSEDFVRSFVQKGGE